jgi:quercetin dioxygenase-like cupin family protein
MMKVRYVRVYADSEGESHFTDEAMELSPATFAPPAPPLSLSAFTPTKQFALLVSPAGWFGDWHTAPHRQFFFRLVGEIEIRVSDGEVRRLGPGSILFVEDTTGKGHTTRNVGDDAIAAVVQLAES